MIFETDRLYLREFTTDDARFLYELNLDPEVLKYTGDAPFNDIQEAHLFVKHYAAYQKFGFGRWAAVLKASDEPIGWCGLKQNPEENNMIDLGFRFFKKYWNQGYATESAKESLQYGFEQLKINEIIARANLNNTASIRVMKKIDMTFWKSELIDDQVRIEYYRKFTHLL